mmetsp:Transcript_34044/g.73676  ORF Transcript_34044/g.73676 Transcript_34044/m.73676 type:complete len:103 (-) Transcript_34044:2474-2782(-)
MQMTTYQVDTIFQLTNITSDRYWNGAGSFSFSKRRRANFCQMSPSSTPRCLAFVMYSTKLHALGVSSALEITWAKSILDIAVISLFIFCNLTALESVPKSAL